MPDVYDSPRPDVVLIAMRLADEVLFPTALETDGDDTVPTERLEALSIIAPPIPVQSLRQSLVASTLGKARTCYDHLGGQLGVALLDDLLRKRALRAAGPGGYEVTARGDRLLGDLGVHASALRAKRRAFARACIDRTEKRPHLAGALGSAVCQAARQTRLSAILGSTPHDRNHLGREQFQLVIAIGAGRDEVEP